MGVERRRETLCGSREDKKGRRGKANRENVRGGWRERIEGRNVYIYL